jgi:uroporphyrinogen decarboxylase
MEPSPASRPAITEHVTYSDTLTGSFVMTGKERVEAALAGRKTDRVPVLASALANAVWLRGVPQRQLHQDPVVLAESVVSAARAFGADGVYVSSDNWIIHEALGGKVFFPEDDEPWGSGAPLLSDWNVLAGLSVPDPHRAGRMPMMLQAARRVVQAVGDELFVEANIDSGPFQLLLSLRGSEEGCLDAVQRPPQLEEFMSFATQVIIAYGRAMARTGVHAIQFGESSAGLVSPDMYRELILPCDRKIIAALQSEGVKVFLHVCGRSTHLRHLLAQTGADCLELDAMVDLDEMFEAVGDRIAIRGNVDTMLLQNGPPDQIERAARQCIEKAARGRRRFILSPGCGVPKYTPLDHVRSLVAAAERSGAGVSAAGAEPSNVSRG